MDYKDIRFHLYAIGLNLATEYPGRNITLYVAGSAAMIIREAISRGTSDIDIMPVKSVSHEQILRDHFANTSVSAHIDCFADGYEERASLIEQFCDVEIKVLSLEDIVVAKLASDRSGDYEDVAQKDVLERININQVNVLARKVIQNALTSHTKSNLSYNIQKYNEKYDAIHPGIRTENALEEPSQGMDEQEFTQDDL